MVLRIGMFETKRMNNKIQNKRILFFLCFFVYVAQMTETTRIPSTTTRISSPFPAVIDNIIWQYISDAVTLYHWANSYIVHPQLLSRIDELVKEKTICNLFIMIEQYFRLPAVKLRYFLDKYKDRLIISGSIIVQAFLGVHWKDSNLNFYGLFLEPHHFDDFFTFIGQYWRPFSDIDITFIIYSKSTNVFPSKIHVTFISNYQQLDLCDYVTRLRDFKFLCNTFNGSQLVLDRDGISDMVNMTANFNPPTISTELKRVEKYRKRGFIVKQN